MLDQIIPLSIAALLGGATLIQISPIKINPWSALAQWFGRTINKEIIDDMNAIKREMEDIKGKIAESDAKDAEREAKNTRIRILRFGDEILHGMEHSKEHFDQILQDITEYDKYCSEHPCFKNDMTRLTTQQIMKAYTVRWEKHDFL